MSGSSELFRLKYYVVVSLTLCLWRLHRLTDPAIPPVTLWFRPQPFTSRTPLNSLFNIIVQSNYLELL
jgi:hypothetical protein